MTAVAPASTDSRSIESIFTQGRSALRFSSAPVPAELIRAAYDLAKWGPTGNNSMPMRLVYAQSDDARATVISHLNEGNRPKADAAPALVIVAADVDYHELVHITSPGVEGLRDHLASQEERRALTAIPNTWLQLGYLTVALRAVGLDVRPLGGFDKAGLDAALFSGTGKRSQAVLLVGYPSPDGDHGSGERKGRPSWDDAAEVL